MVVWATTTVLTLCAIMFIMLYWCNSLVYNDPINVMILFCSYLV